MAISYVTQTLAAITTARSLLRLLTLRWSCGLLWTNDHYLLPCLCSHHRVLQPLLWQPLPPKQNFHRIYLVDAKRELISFTKAAFETHARSHRGYHCKRVLCTWMRTHTVWWHWQVTCQLCIWFHVTQYINTFNHFFLVACGTSQFSDSMNHVKKPLAVGRVWVVSVMETLLIVERQLSK